MLKNKSRKVNTETKLDMKILRLIILLSLLLCGSESINAAKGDSIAAAQFCCIYKHWTKTSDLKRKAVNDSTIAVLEVGDNVSKYGDFFSYKGLRPSGYTSGFMEGDPRASDGVAVYRDYPQKGVLTVREGLLPYFYIYDEQPALKWKLVDGQENVLGYKCKKAVAEYGGRTWSVCYAEDVPSTTGPWKLAGLPGLILKAESQDGVHKFVAQALFDVEGQGISFDKNTTDVAVKRDKFISLRNRLKCDKRWAKNASYYVNPSEIKSISIVKGDNNKGLAAGMNINGINLPTSGGFERQFQPLELK